MSNPEPTYRGGELTQLRRERELYKAQVALLELQVAQLQAASPKARLRAARDPWRHAFMPAVVLLAGASVCLGVLLGKLLQVSP